MRPVLLLGLLAVRPVRCSTSAHPFPVGSLPIPRLPEELPDELQLHRRQPGRDVVPQPHDGVVAVRADVFLAVAPHHLNGI